MTTTRRRKLPRAIRFVINALTNSDRCGHLPAAIITGGIMIVTAVTLGMPLLFKAGVFCGLWEWLATSDVDLVKQRKLIKASPWTLVNLFWFPYSLLIPRHRHPLSHSLLLGLPCRLLYALIVVNAIVWFITGTLLTPPDPSNWFNVAWQWKAALLGFAVADVIHLSKDGYGLVEMAIGR